MKATAVHTIETFFIKKTATVSKDVELKLKIIVNKKFVMDCHFVVSVPYFIVIFVDETVI